MSRGVSKRFQSGREIFRTYIPNYEPPSSVAESEAENPTQAGADLASQLLKKFSSQLEQIEAKFARDARPTKR